MKTDTEIRAAGVRSLIIALGTVEAERFVALLLREPFDYTEWRQGLWPGVDVETLAREASAATETSARVAEPDEVQYGKKSPDNGSANTSQ